MEKSIYNIGYYEKMLREYSSTASTICGIRWEFLKLVLPHVETVLDYGSGVGWFRAFRPEHVRVDSFDLAREYPQTGILLKRYDLVCLWDVLEHLPSFATLLHLLDGCKFVALTVPIKPDQVQLENWKHFKPKEHLHIFTVETIQALFDRFGFAQLKVDKPESPPREDVYSFIFSKKGVLHIKEGEIDEQQTEEEQKKRYEEMDRSG